jgi:hypothetical protein
LAIPNYIIPINKGKKKKKGKVRKNIFSFFFWGMILLLIYRTYYIIPINKKRKERERGKNLLFFLYDSAINIHVFMLGN